MRLILVAAGALLVLALAGAAWLVTSEPGLRFAAARIEPLLPDGSSLGEVSGRLIGPIEARGLVFETPAARIEIATAQVEYRFRALLRRRLRIQTLTAAGVTVTPAPAAEEERRAGEPLSLELPRPPLPLIVEQAHLDGLTILGARGARFEIERADVSGRYGNRGLVLRRIAFEGPNISVDGDLSLARGEAVASRIHFRFQPPEYAELRGELRASGNASRLDVGLILESPYGVELTGVLRDALGTPAWDARVLVGQLSPSAVRADWPAGTLTADARLSGDAARVSGDIELDAALAQLPQISATLSGSADSEHIEVDALRVRRRAQPGVVAARGDVWLADDGPRFELDLDWRDVEAAISDTLTLQSPNGRGELTGTLADYAFLAEGALRSPEWEGGLVRLAGRGTPARIVVSELRAEGLGASLSATGELDFGVQDAPYTASVTLQAAGLDPGLIHAELAGDVAFALEAAATVSKQAHRQAGPQAGDAGDSRAQAVGRLESWRLSVTDLAGNLRDQPLSGSARASGGPRSIAIEELTLDVGDLHTEVTGEIGQRSALEWTLRAPALDALVPGLSGSVASRGRLAGAPGSLRVTGTLDAAALRYGDAEVAEAHIDADIDENAPGDSRLVGVRTSGLAVAPLRATGLELTASGSLRSHTVELNAARGEEQLASTRLSGGLTEAVWSGQIEALRLTGYAGRPWVLAEPGGLTFGPDRLRLESVCLGHEDSRLCARAERDTDGSLAGSLTLDALPLGSFSALLPPALDYGGDVSGALDFAAGDGSLSGVASVQVSAGAILQREPARSLLVWTGANINARLQQTRLVTGGRFDLEGGGYLDVQANLPVAGARLDREASMDVRIEGVVQDLPLLSALLPDVSDLSAESRLNLAVGGSLAAPTLDGSARLSDGSALLPRLGITLEDVDVEVAGSGSGVTVTGNARSGEGRVEVDGRFGLEGTRWDGNARLTGERFTAIDTPELTAVVSPFLQLAVAGRDITLVGEVTIPQARVAPGDLSSAVRVSQDQVIVGRAAQAPEERWQVTTRVRLLLGEDVTFKGFGLTGDIEGALFAIDKPGRSTTGTGELRLVDGEYTLYGQTLDVERGRLLFNGSPLDNPGLDVRAQREIEDVTVGIDLRGPLQEPEVTLFSSPALSQSDTLAYLVTGRPVTGLSESDQSLLGSAAQQLGIGGANLLAAQVGRRLGVDAFGIQEGGNEEEAAFVVGKYLSPKLYVSYGLGLFEAFNTLLVRYEITPRISIETQTGEETSADVVYTLER